MVARNWATILLSTFQLIDMSNTSKYNLQRVWVFNGNTASDTDDGVWDKISDDDMFGPDGSLTPVPIPLPVLVFMLDLPDHAGSDEDWFDYSCIPESELRDIILNTRSLSNLYDSRLMVFDSSSHDSNTATVSELVYQSLDYHAIRGTINDISDPLERLRVVFRNLLHRMYGQRFSNFSNDSVEYLPILIANKFEEEDESDISFAILTPTDLVARNEDHTDLMLRCANFYRSIGIDPEKTLGENIDLWLTAPSSSNRTRYDVRTTSTPTGSITTINTVSVAPETETTIPGERKRSRLLC